MASDLNEFMPDPEAQLASIEQANPTDKAPELTMEQRVGNLEQACMLLIERCHHYEAAIEGGYNALAYLIEQIILFAEQPHTLASVLQKLLDEGVPQNSPDE